jgi:hypothetical protein
MNWRNGNLSEENHIYYKEESLQHDFLMKTELVFERNIAYLSEISSGRNIHFVQNRPIQMNWRNTYISWKKTIYFKRRSVQDFVSMWELSYFVKVILAVCQHFVWENHYFRINILFRSNGDTFVSFQQYNLC